MGDHGKRKIDPPPVDLSEPGAIIPLWYWKISPRAWMWEPARTAPPPRPRSRSKSPAVVTAMLLALLGGPTR
jgi:hypothetical protein